MRARGVEAVKFFEGWLVDLARSDLGQRGVFQDAVAQLSHGGFPERGVGGIGALGGGFRVPGAHVLEGEVGRENAERQFYGAG